jgi:hypothetical protein
VATGEPNEDGSRESLLSGALLTDMQIESYARRRPLDGTLDKGSIPFASTKKENAPEQGAFSLH